MFVWCGMFVWYTLFSHVNPETSYFFDGGEKYEVLTFVLQIMCVGCGMFVWYTLFSYVKPETSYFVDGG